ncbi:hypothetical protein EM308_13100 [Flavobacterium gilvum]|uniref:Uncharacterized protein n=1 Tax=Flavobacterium gilvum TaxID=1492737 RepID=A0AAC9N723_9FLAO|nr:hypothetical protein EM308_13100 [Flavobacterium gilvum]KFC60698.1 hypothetical protein FEM08_05300 [Flavobacterium gilvum]
MSEFVLYIRQRFSLSIFLSLTVFLLLFSKTKLVFGIEDAYNFGLIMFFLLIMRLYDDLQNSVIDSKKIDRIYTNAEAKKRLTFVLMILIFGFLWVLFFYKTVLIKGIILFFCLNHILYLLLFKSRNFKSYLPLLKYPLAFIALQGQFSLVSISLFLSMIVFEILDDFQFPIQKKYCIIFAVLSMLILIPNLKIINLVTLLIVFPIVVFIVLKNIKTAPYLFLLLFLLTRLIFISNEI